MKTCSSLVRTALIAAIAVTLTPSLFAQHKQQPNEKIAATDPHVAELAKMAMERLGGQAGQQAKAPQGPTTDLRVEDAVQRAMDNNIDLAVAKLNPQLQDLSLAGLRGTYRPTVTSTMGDSSRGSAGTSTISGASAGQTTNTQTYTYSGGIQQILPWTGGTALVTFSNTRDFTDSNNYYTNPTYSATLRAQITQSLWRNFRIDSTRQQLWTGIISRQIADVSLRATALNTAANTRNAYWDLVYAIEAVKVAQQSLSLADKLVQDNQARVEIGTLAPLDVITAQSQAATAKRTLVQAEQTRVQNELTLKRFIVSSTQDPLWNATLNPVDRPDPEVTPLPIDISAAIANALSKRTDLITARENLKSNDITLKYNKNQTLPDASLTAYYSTLGTGGDLYARGQSGAPPVFQRAGGYVDALSILRQLQVPSWSVSVTFSYPIGTSVADANYARAKVQYQQSVTTLKSSELNVATQVTQAALNVRSSLEQVAAARAARELSQRRLEAEQSKFEVGMQTSYFVVQAQNDLLNAQTAELQAIASYRKNLVIFQLVQEAPQGGGGSGGSGVSATSGGTSSGGSSGGQ